MIESEVYVTKRCVYSEETSTFRSIFVATCTVFAKNDFSYRYILVASMGASSVSGYVTTAEIFVNDPEVCSE